MPTNFPTHKYGIAAVALVACCAGANLFAADDPVILRAHPKDRYEALLEKSPFAVATAEPPPVAPEANFATNWVVTGLSKNRTQDGPPVYTAFIRSRDLSVRMVLTGDKPNADGVSIVSVDEAPVAAKSTVTLKKGEETGKVGFDQAAITATPTPAPGAPPSATPGAPAKPGATGVRPATASRAPIPRPGMSAQPRAATPGTPPVQQPRGRVRTVEEAPAPAQ